MAGRPRKEIDYDKVLELASDFATQIDIADELDISVRKLQQDEQFMRIYKRGITTAKAKLRRAQFKNAIDGNTTMQIWLGKQYLQQKEPKQEFDIDTNTEVITQIKQLTDKI